MSDLIEHAGIDPYRLVAAAHEIAHALGFAAAGVLVTEIKVRGRGESVSGYVFVPGNTVVHDLRAFAMAHLAGRAADLRWCDEHGLARLPERTCAPDSKDLKQFMRDAQHTQTLGSVRRDAERFVHANWSRITRLAPRLATRGQLSPASLPVPVAA
uniref:hypothetical protein n=1 Tax=Amycolatopsis sp. CA-082387 TaxID=3239918 RepID=UPI003F494324